MAGLQLLIFCIFAIQARSENAVQCAASLEPILSVRRELLKLHSMEDTKENIAQLLIQVREPVFI